MSATAAIVTTAKITPELFPEHIISSSSRALIVTTLALLFLFGFSLRAYRLGAEGLSEDELNKVKAVAEYRERGLTAANGEHPFLMKALMTVSISAADGWNASRLTASRPALRVSTETAARLPCVLLGALSAILIFLVTSELFGAEVGLIAAALWALDPAAVGFNRIAKEDSFLLFFFLLTNVFWLRGQRAAEGGRRRPESFYWAAAASFGAMMASKYVPHFLAISGAYYWSFQGMEATRWKMGKRKWLAFFLIAGAAFVVCNPTILLPGTWHEMRIFAGEKRIGHDSYEYLGQLYRNQLTMWLEGVPWHFYFVFMWVKLPIPVLVAFLAGLPLLFKRRLGDGRYFVIFWLYFWFFSFSFLGGKFTRYFTMALPAVHITAALGLHAASLLFERLLSRTGRDETPKLFARAALPLFVFALSLSSSVSAAPNYRLYTNYFGGGRERAGSYFPHDEFYDASLPATLAAVARLARAGARVASETPELATYYARHAGRADLRSVSLSDRAALRDFEAGDVVIVARGRRYFSNDALVSKLQASGPPAAEISLGGIQAARVYVLDDDSLRNFQGALDH
ncbi:MAG: glycosyltransferase family 39 protein [Acidobacteria bacterium]|nr:glycosyltransferase family 39 protein [Acidobacteriota bacterium]